MDNIFRIVCATGNPKMDEDLRAFEDLDIVDCCNIISDIPLAVKEHHPDVLLVTDKIGGEGSILQLMHDLKVQYRDDLRIVYFAGAVKDWDNDRKYQIANLMSVGIYDIDTSDQFDCYTILDLIKVPKSSAVANQYLSKIFNKTSEIKNASFGYHYIGRQELQQQKENSQIPCIVFSAAKPGTGKSTAAISAAVLIARYGLKSPKVALIDGDMQTLSVGNFLGLPPDEKRNIKVALENVKRLLSGKLESEDDERKARKTIKDCFVKYPKVPNLKVLCGSQISPQEIDSIGVKADYFTTLVKMIRDDYDIIIVDLNSSLYHASSYGLLQSCKSCYFVINMDYNNVQNNKRYKEVIDSFGTTGKLRYILNKSIENTKEYRWAGFDFEELYLTADRIDKEYFPLAVKIPAVPETVYNNAQFEGIPLAMYRKPYTRSARLALMDIANEIWPLDSNYEHLKKQVEADRKKGYSFPLFRRKVQDDVIVTAEEKMSTAVSALPELSDEALVELQGAIQMEQEKRRLASANETIASEMADEE